MKQRNLSNLILTIYNALVWLHYGIFVYVTYFYTKWISVNVGVVSNCGSYVVSETS